MLIRIVKDVKTFHVSIRLCGVKYAELLKSGIVSKAKQSLSLRLSVSWDFFVLLKFKK